MTDLMLYALIGYFVGVIIRRFINAESGEVVEVIAAILFIILWLVGAIRTT